MGDTSIEWCDKTWNPIRGCRRVSPGCVNCYAEAMAGRFCGPGQAYEGLAKRTPNGARWTGTVRLVSSVLADPLRWKKPRRVFVNSMSDLFHEGLSNEDIDRVFAVMALAPQHTFQILTKRPERLRAYMTEDGIGRVGFVEGRAKALAAETGRPIGVGKRLLWPLANVWLGVSVEDQATADERIPLLLETPAAVRFVSYEPALGPVTFQGYAPNDVYPSQGRGWLEPFHDTDAMLRRTPRLDWIIAGSESGPGARPAELDWFRSTRDQCAAAGVSFFFKQWVGETYEDGNSVDGVERAVRRKHSLPLLDGHRHAEFPR